MTDDDQEIIYRCCFSGMPLVFFESESKTTAVWCPSCNVWDGWYVNREHLDMYSSGVDHGIELCDRVNIDHWKSREFLSGPRTRLKLVLGQVKIIPHPNIKAMK